MAMDADRYQDLAGRTLIDKPDFELKREHAAHAQELLDFAASVGAIAEYIKKGIFHQHGFDELELAKLYRKAMRYDDNRGVPWMNDDMVMMLWNVIGLIGEVGEIATLIADAIHSGQPIDMHKMQKELGDCSWYTAAIATRSRLSLGCVLEDNIAKLQQRYPNGYSAADSVARVDVTADYDTSTLAGVDAWLSRPDVDSDKCICGGGAVCWCHDGSPLDCPARATEDKPVYKSPLGGLLEEIGATFFDGEPDAIVLRQFINDGEYMANLTFDGKVLLDTEGNQDPSLITGCASTFEIKPACRAADEATAVPDDNQRDEACQQLCRNGALCICDGSADYTRR